MRNSTLARSVGMLAAAMLVPLSACEQVLSVENPQEIGVEELNDPQLLDAQVTGVLWALSERMSGDEEALTQGTAFLTDEQLTGLNWEDWQRNNQRIVIYTEGAVNSLWGSTSRIIQIGENALEKLNALAENPATDSRVALVEAMVGYGYLFAGETMCQSVFGPPDAPGGTLNGPLEAVGLAVPHFESAITVGLASGATDVVNLARVGLARAHLTLGNFQEVINNAQVVPAGFQWWVEYSDADGALNNNLFNEVHGSNHTVGVAPKFLQGTYGQQGLVDTQTDPRIQHTSDFSNGHDRSTVLYKPYQGLRFSGYTGATVAPQSAACPNCTPGGANEGNGDNGDVILFQRETNVLLADYTEAQHHMHEAMMRQGGNDGAVNTFVNARRAVGNQAPVSLTGDALFAELREQRGRDLFMGGFRLGDLRRWARDGVGNFFPSGAHPNPDRPPAQYGPWTCWAFPIQEYDGNPNLEKPADPLAPPPGII
jgi:hypothetical protein